MGFGQRIVTENENVKVQNLGKVGSPIVGRTAEGVEVRGTIGFDPRKGDAGFDQDFYRANADWVRDAQGNSWDMTHVSSALSFSTNTMADEIGALVVCVWDGYGNLVATAFDFIVGAEARAMLGEEALQILEGSDVDFSSPGPNEAHDPLTWSYPPIVGAQPNTFTVGIMGFNIDMDGNYRNMAYTMDWSFA